MTALSFQDTFFLRAESATCPLHVAALMILSPPSDATGDYMRRVAGRLSRLNEIWPVFDRRLRDPGWAGRPSWIKADDFNPADHIFHYALPKPGRMDDLLKLVGHAHEQKLDRTRPLWQVHLVEGMEHGRFAVYIKVHHALVDGVGGLRMIDELCSRDPEAHVRRSATTVAPDKPQAPAMPAQGMADSMSSLMKQATALPEVASILARLGWGRLLGEKAIPQLPFSAPGTILNSKLDTRRKIIVCELPLRRVKQIGRHYRGTINDVLVAICGSALRKYLLGLNALPKRSLDAGLPVSVKATGRQQGNQLSIIICPFATDLSDPVKRLRRVIRSTRKAKSDIGHVSATATEDLATLVMIPFLMLSVTHSSQAVPPVFNTILSNVPGPADPIYFDGARLERIYPISVITDGMGLNITIISYRSKLCFAITSCPTRQPGIESLGRLIRAAYAELRDTLD